MSARVRSTPVGLRRLLIGALCTLVLALALSASAKAEIPNHPFIGALISGLEPEPKPLRPRLEKPCGVTVTQDGAIYVSDYARQSVIGTSLTKLFPENGPCGLAYDGNNLYVNEFHGVVVNTETGVIDAGRATGIAVNPLTKDLYVSHRNEVDVYEAPVEPGNPPAHVFGTGTLGNAYGVAVSAFRPPKGTSTSPTPPITPSRSMTRRWPRPTRRSRSSMAPTPPRGASSRLRTPASPSIRATATSSSSTTPRRLPNIPPPPSTSSTRLASSAASSNTRSSTERRSGSPSTNPRRPQTARST